MRDTDALIAFIDSRQKVPHQWGRDNNDCVSFVLGAVKAQTGEDVAPKLRWKSFATGMRAINRLGGLEAALDKYFTRIAPSFAKRGDIAGVPDDELGISPAIVEGETVVAPGPKGNCRLKRNRMTVAWGIDRE